MVFKLFLLNISRVLHFYYDQRFVCANDTGVCGCCHVQRMVQIHAVWIDTGVCDSDTECSSKEQWK